MAEIGMLRFETVSFPAKCGASGNSVENGLFGIPKNDAPESRLITDMRPGNGM
jgi:predicted RecA/RadA family phage recombinase